MERLPRGEKMLFCAGEDGLAGTEPVADGLGSVLGFV